MTKLLLIVLVHVCQEIKTRNFRHCNSDANKVSKSGGTLKVE